jgi:ankyrin repeat protein
MAIQNSQASALKYLLGLKEYFTIDTILDDTDNEGTTLLSASVQLGKTEIIDILLEFILKESNDVIVSRHFRRADNRGRTVAHYLFDAHYLITQIGHLLPWCQKDKNRQTPLFALCRCYDHPNYREMVEEGLSAAANAQGDCQPLHLDDHVDAKGNTLLHVVKDPQLALHLMFHCDSDINATNDKKFTALMVASKYGRVDMVRALFSDARVDITAKELRGLTAVELAKDDDVRNRIDDLILFSNSPADDGRFTAVVRSFFVEDATIRLVLKSGAPSKLSRETFTVTTCRRSLTDFQHLAQLLSLEHPASWLPAITNFRSPFQIPSKPSRAVLRDIQVRLDSFLKALLSHSTFSTHEMLWEFFLVPDMQPEMMDERSRKKAEIRAERVKNTHPLRMSRTWSNSLVMPGK